MFSAGREGAWAIFRFGKEYPQLMPGMRFPVAAQAEFWKQMVPDSLNSLPTPNPTVPALSELAQKTGGTVLMSHSQSGIYPFQTAVLSRKGIAGIVSIEPGACPAPTDDMTPYADLPILVLFGDYVDEFPALGAAVEELPRLYCRRQRGRRQGRAVGAARHRDQGQHAHADAGRQQS